MTVNALSADSVELPLGGIWDISVDVRDVDGCLVDDDVPVVTITLPDSEATTDTPTVATVSTGVYRAEYALEVAGRYVARAVTNNHGAADFAAYAAGATAAGGMPDLAEVLDYLDWDEDTPTGEAAGALAAESTAQRRKCRVGAVYPDDMRNALLRRVARNLAFKGVPLAVLRGNTEDGALVLPGNDPEVRRWEAPYRKLTMG